MFGSIQPAYLAYKLAVESPLQTIVPKRVHNFIYRRFIASRIQHYTNLTQPDAIFATEPTPCDRSSDAKLWIVSSGADVLMAAWCLKSILHFSQCSWDVWFADAGGITSSQQAQLDEHFPNFRFLAKRDLDDRAREALAEYPLSSWLRHERGYAPAMKLFDPILNLKRGRFLLIDSDVLFFEMPSLLIELIKKSRPSEMCHFNMEPQGTINSGLAVIDLSLISLPEIESCLARMQPRQLKGWPIEQDVYTELTTGKFRPLPASYAVQPIDDLSHHNLTSCHYIGVCRHRFYAQGIARLRSQRFMGLAPLHNEN